MRRSKALPVVFIIALLTGVGLVPSPRALADGTQVPKVSSCELESTQRVASRVDGQPRGAVILGERLSFFNAKKEWLADEITDGELSAPIPTVIGLFEPRAVAAVRCYIDGFVSVMDQHGFVDYGGSGPGRKTCPVPGGLIVDGGPDAYVERALYGKDWIMIRLQLSINHFFPNQKSAFTGDVFAASIDRGPDQKVVVTGDDPQDLSLLFTGLRPGLHEIAYHPWATFDAVATNNNYHNFCVKLG